jgi:predicted amidohydrolase
MRIALAQIVTGFDLSLNLAQVVQGISAAAEAGASLVIFPEATMSAFGVSLLDVAQRLEGPWATSVRVAATAAGVTVVVGMFTPGSGGRVRNTLCSRAGVRCRSRSTVL